MSEHPRGVTGTAVDGQLPSAEQARDLEALQPWTPPRAPREHPASHGEKGNTGGHPGTRMASPSAWGASILAPGTERAPSGLPGAAREGGVLEGGVSFLNSYFGAFVVASKNGRFFAALTRGLCLLACCAWSWGAAHGGALAARATAPHARGRVHIRVVRADVECQWSRCRCVCPL